MVLHDVEEIRGGHLEQVRVKVCRWAPLMGMPNADRSIAASRNSDLPP
jgi:hypothetical protein